MKNKGKSYIRKARTVDDILQMDDVGKIAQELLEKRDKIDVCLVIVLDKESEVHLVGTNLDDESTLELFERAWLRIFDFRYSGRSSE